MDLPKSMIDIIKDALAPFIDFSNSPAVAKAFEGIQRAHGYAMEACGRTLTRIEQDPHLSYLIGEGSETRVLLIKAFAQLSGRSADDVEKQFPVHPVPLNPREPADAQTKGEVVSCSEQSMVGLVELLQALDRECFVAQGRVATCEERVMLEAVWRRAEGSLE